MSHSFIILDTLTSKLFKTYSEGVTTVKQGVSSIQQTEE